MLRLMAIVPPDALRMTALADRLKMATAEMLRLRRWAETSVPKPDLPEAELAKMIYRGDRQAVTDRLRLALASARARAVENDAALVEAGAYARLLKFVGSWRAPEFPIKGGDLVLIGATAGPAVGKLLRRLQEQWVESGFELDRGALLERAAQGIKAGA